MTVIAVRKYKDKIHIAADSIITQGYHIVSDKTLTANKLFESNGLIIGGSGLYSELCLLELFTKNHKPKTSELCDVLEFTLEFTLWGRRHRENFTSENCYLMVLDDKVFEIYDGSDVYEVKEFAAIGAGYHYALTAMHLGQSPDSAVKTACDMCIWCNEPVTEIIKTL